MQLPQLLVSVPDARVRNMFVDVPEGVYFIDWGMTGPAPVEAIDIVVLPYMGATGKLSQLASVKTRLVQSLSLGYDGVENMLPPGHVYSNAISAHETSTAELTLALILAAQRGIPDLVRAAEKGNWAPKLRPSMADRTVLLIGYGGVGQAIEARLLPFEVTIVRVARTARSDERGIIYGNESVPELLPHADIVVIAVPLADDTTGLVDDGFLPLMRDDGLLVNIARGKVANTDALLLHASAGRLRLALDVSDPEPLPEGHPLFALATVLISPHIGGTSTAMAPRVVRLLTEQVLSDAAWRRAAQCCAA